MKVMSRWKVKQGSLPELVNRYKTGAAASVEGVTLLARWMRVDMTEGVSIYEVTDPSALLAFIAKWADVLESETFPVLDEKEAAPVLLGLFKS